MTKNTQNYNSQVNNNTLILQKLRNFLKKL
jgi:hypothetical protein